MLTPETLEFVMVSLEGPDRYSQAGGLGVRARELCRALAAQGFRTTLVFVGDPERPAQEMDAGVRLVRWGQPLSRLFPAGVYQGEEAKLAHLEATLPPFLVDGMVRPAVEEGRIVAVLAEEWQTAEFCRLLSDALHAQGLRERCAIVWNANNQYGFDRIDWGTLQFVSTVTTVSRYMKHLMAPWGAAAIVVHNGIPESALVRPDASGVRALRRAAQTPCLLFKIGRFTPDKGWLAAVEATALLRRHGVPARLLMRGGIEPHGGEVLAHCAAHGLDVAGWREPVRSTADVSHALRATAPAAVVDLRTFLPDEVVPSLYAAATCVLANSVHEPFGLVGLEAMAAGAVALVGATGEEYARPYVNALVVETHDPAEIASMVQGLLERPQTATRVRVSARRAAAEFVWPRIVNVLLERLGYICEHQGVELPARSPSGAASLDEETRP